MKTRYDVLVLLIGIGDAVTNPESPEDHQAMYDALRGAVLPFVATPGEGAAAEALSGQPAGSSSATEEAPKVPIRLLESAALEPLKAPTVTGCIPFGAIAGSDAFDLTIDGQDFDDVLVYIGENDDPCGVLYRSPTRLVVRVEPKHIPESGEFDLVVINERDGEQQQEGRAKFIVHARPE